MKFAIFMTTACRNTQDERYATVERLCIRQLQEHLSSKAEFSAGDNRKQNSSVRFLDGIYNQEEIFKQIEQNSANAQPILHIILNSDRKNNLFTIQALQAFKSRGGKIVITFAQFDEFRFASQKNVALNYLYCADHIFFLDELDKKAALESVKHHFPSEKGFKARLEKATVTSTFPADTYLASNKPEERERNILFLGTVRPNRGLAHIRKLAGLLAKSEDPKLRNKKIIIVAQAANEIRHNRALMELIETIYPTKKDELQNKTTEQLKELLQAYQSEAGLKPEVAMELHLESHVNVKKAELSKLYDQCTYCFLPTPGGLSLQDHAFTEALSQKFVVISHNGESTAITLKNSDLGKALCIAENDDFKTYAEAVMAKILERENNPTLNNETFALLRKIEGEHLNADKIVMQHIQVYQSLSTDADLKTGREVQEKFKTLTHSFQAWRNMPLTLKHACIQEARSFATMCKIQGIDTIARANKNYNALISRLRKLEGPYSDAMKQHLLSQNIGSKGATSYLTKEEKVLFKKLMASNWTMKHVTEHIKVINENGAQLLSVEERKRRADENKFSHTPALEGNADNVFFSFGPGDIPTVRFLDRVDTYIEVDYKQLIQDYPNPDVEDNALHGFWSSDHFFAYGAEQDGEPINIYGSRYFVNYRKVVDEQSGLVRWVKNCHFIHPDGKTYKQTIEKGDEIFIHPRVDIALVLLTIEKIRLLGLEAWQKIMQETDLKAIQSLVYTIYHTGVFEVHKPEQFILDQPGVQVKTRQNRYTEQATAAKSGIINPPVIQGKELLKAAVTGNIDYVMKELSAGTDVNKSYSLELDHTSSTDKLRISNITVLSAAILSGQSELVKKLLEMGVELHVYDTGTQLCVQTGPTSSQSFNISVLTTTCFTTTIQKLQQSGDIYPALKKSLFGDLPHEWDYKKISESAQIILKMLLEQGSNIKDNKNIQSLYCPDPERELAQIYAFVQPEPNLMLYLMQHLPDKAPDHALINAVQLQHYDVAKKLLELGSDPNQEFNHFYGHLNPVNFGLLTSLTPLLVAIDKNDLKMIQLLVQNKADVNKAYYETGAELVECPAKITVKTGQTPLMFAIEKGNPEIVRFLLENNADILKPNLSGLNALEFARKLDNNEIEKILLEKLETLKKSQQTNLNSLDSFRKMNSSSPDIKLASEGAKLTIYDHRVYVIAKAQDRNKETFFLLNTENYTRRNLESLHDGFLHTFNAKEWITDLRQQASAAFNFNDLKFTDYAEIQMGIKETGTHYMAKFIICDFGIQNEAFFFAMKESESFGILSVTELMQKTSEARISNSPLGFKYNEQYITDLEADLFLQISGKIEKVTPEMQERIFKKFYKQIQDQCKLVHNAQTGNIKGIEEAVSSGTKLDFLLPSQDAEKYKKGDYGNKYEMISYSPLDAAVLHKQFDCALYLLEHGIDANKGNVISWEMMNEIVAAGQIKLFKELERQKHWSATQNFESHALTCIKHGQLEFLKYIISIAKIEDYGKWLPHHDTIKCFNFGIISLLCENAQDSAIGDYVFFLSNCYIGPESYFTAEEIKKFKENAEPGRIYDRKSEDEIFKIFQHLLPKLKTRQVDIFHTLISNAVIYQNLELGKLVLQWKSKSKDGLTPEMLSSALSHYKLHNSNYMKHLEIYTKLLRYLAESDLDPKAHLRTALLKTIDSTKAACNEEEQKAFVEASEKLYSEILPQATQMKEAIIKGDAEKAFALLKQGFDPELVLMSENKNRSNVTTYNVLCFEQISLMNFALMHKRYDIAQYLADSKVKVTNITPHISIENLIRDGQIGLLKYLAAASDEQTLKSINSHIFYNQYYNSYSWGVTLYGLDQSNGLNLLISALEAKLTKEKGQGQQTQAQGAAAGTEDSGLLGVASMLYGKFRV